jgi:hypothetical protein
MPSSPPRATVTSKRSSLCSPRCHTPRRSRCRACGRMEGGPGRRGGGQPGAQLLALGLFVRPALVNGAAGLVATRDGRPFSVGGFTVRGGKIVEIDILAGPSPPRRARPDDPRRLTLGATTTPLDARPDPDSEKKSPGAPKNHRSETIFPHVSDTLDDAIPSAQSSRVGVTEGLQLLCNSATGIA